VVRDEPTAGAIDPALAEAIERVHRLDNATGPDPVFVARLEGDLMRTLATFPPISADHPRVHSNGRVTPPPRFVRLPVFSMPREGRRWALAQFATALRSTRSTAA
jgi:hypothetical protein